MKSFTYFVVLFSTLCSASRVLAIGVGPFDFNNFILTEPGPSAPLEVEVEGSAVPSVDGTLLEIFSPDGNCEDENCGPNSEPPYIFAFTTTATESGYATFDWTYDTTDGADFDQLVVWRNDVPFLLIDPSGEQTQQGTAGINLGAGDIFGFGLVSSDSCCGPSTSTVFNLLFEAGVTGAEGPFFGSPIPIPAAFWLFGSAVFGLLGMRRRYL